MKIAALLLSLLVAAGTAAAAVTVYTSESAYLAALAGLGHDAVVESFEDDAAWGHVRSTIGGGFHTAPSVTNLGVVWTPNNPNSGVTTGHGPARTGEWGFYEYPHGDFANGVNDGWVMSAVTVLYGMGGWFETNTFGAQISLTLDGVQVVQDFPLDYAHQFLGVIETDGFVDCEVREIEAGGDEALYIFADDFTFGVAAGTAAPGGAPAFATRLLPAHPNPFNPATTLTFDLARAGRVDLSVHDVAGRRVRTLVDGEAFAPGRHERAWEGRDDAGRPLPSGVYLARLSGATGASSRRLVLAK
jgi:hypothetical protein